MSGNLKPRIPNTRLQYVGVGTILAFVLLVTLYFSSGNKTAKTQVGPDVHPGPPYTGVYLKFDTSKYTKDDGKVFIPDDSVLSKMSLAEAEELYHRYQENIEISCPLQLHVGDEFEGGYHICEPYIHRNTCLAYTFGVTKEFSFDDGLVSLFGCKVHSFVPLDGDDNHKHLDGVKFHKIGVGGRDELIKKHTEIRAMFKTFDSIRTMLDHDHTPIDIIKMDIRGTEWLTLRQMLDAKSLQNAKVKTLIITFDIVNEKRDLYSYLYMLYILRELNDLGYKRYFFRMWWHNCLIHDSNTKVERTGCHEVHFLKV